jgi:hypothetical protein
MTLLLSKYRARRSIMLGTTLNLVMNFLIQTFFFVVLDAKIYSTSVVEYVVVSYLEVFQLTTPPFKVKTYLD